MIKYDADHPDGIKLSPAPLLTPEPAPVTIRQMTAEERERYGPSKKRKKSACPWTKRRSSKCFGEV